MLPARNGPELPAFQSFSMPQVKEGVNVIVCDNVSFPALDVKGEQDEINFIAKEPVLEMAVKGDQRGVILFGNAGPLLEVKRKQSEAADVGFGLRASTRKTEELAELKTILRTEAIVSQQRIHEIEFLVIDFCIPGM